MRFGMWNVMKLYRSVTLTAAARELARYKLDLVGVQEVRWDKRGHCKSRDYNFFYGRGKKIINWEWDFCTQQNGTLRRTKIHRSDISDVPPRQSRDVQLPS